MATGMSQQQCFKQKIKRNVGDFYLELTSAFFGGFAVSTANCSTK